MSGWISALNGFASVWAEAVIRASWQGGIAIALVWLVCRALPRLSPDAQCWLWRLAYLKLLVALFWATPLDLPVLPAATPPAVRPATAGVPARPAPARIIGAVPVAATRPAIQRPAPGTGSATPSGSASLFSLWMVLLGAWTWQVAREAAAARRLRREGCLAREEWLLADAADLGRRLRISRSPQLRLGNELATPVMTGIARPAVVLPVALLREAARGEVRCLLAHELAHLKRRDLWWNALSVLAHGLFPFHPLVWLAGKEARLAQEMACDAVALRVTAAPVAAYGDALLRVAAAGGTRSFRGTAALAVVESYATLKRRFAALECFSPGARRGAARLVPLLLILAALAILPWRLTTVGKERRPVRPGPSTGDRIVFASSRDGDMEIYTMRADGAEVQRLTDDPRTDARPEWSPDRKQITWQKNCDGNLEIYVMDADGSHPRNLTRNPANDEMPTWSPDGRRIVFTRALGMVGRWPNRKLFVMDADGSNVRQLTVGPAPDWAPAWSPDGEQIAFSSTRETGWNRIWMVNADGSDPHPVSRDGGNDFSPAWSPDGRQLLFDRHHRGGTSDTLMSISRDGAVERVVMPDLPSTLYPDYSPDGKKAVFSRGGEIVALDLATGVVTPLAGRRRESVVPVEQLFDPVTGEAKPWAREMSGEAHFPRWRR